MEQTKAKIMIRSFVIQARHKIYIERLLQPREKAMTGHRPDHPSSLKGRAGRET